MIVSFNVFKNFVKNNTKSIYEIYLKTFKNQSFNNCNSFQKFKVLMIDFKTNS